MREYRYFFLLNLIMAAVALVVGATAILALYWTALEEQRLRLMETAQSQARMIEAVAFQPSLYHLSSRCRCRDPEPDQGCPQPFQSCGLRS